MTISVDEPHTLMLTAAFEHVRRLSEVHTHVIANELKPGFEFNGECIPHIDPQRGIFKPQQMRFWPSARSRQPVRTEFGCNPPV